MLYLFIITFLPEWLGSSTPPGETEDHQPDPLWGSAGEGKGERDAPTCSKCSTWRWEEQRYVGQGKRCVHKESLREYLEKVRPAVLFVLLPLSSQASRRIRWVADEGKCWSEGFETRHQQNTGHSSEGQSKRGVYVFRAEKSAWQLLKGSALKSIGWPSLSLPPLPPSLPLSLSLSLSSLQRLLLDLGHRGGGRSPRDPPLHQWKQKETGPQQKLH